MKYFDTPVEEQETTINICYEDETVQIYSNRVEVIKNLTHNIGKPTKRDKRGKKYVQNYDTGPHTGGGKCAYGTQSGMYEPGSGRKLCGIL